VLKGEELPEEEMTTEDMDEMVNAEHHKIAQDFMDTSEIKYGYCTEFMVELEDEKMKENPFDEETFRNELSERGDSLLVVSDDEIVKVHVHTEYPGEAMTMGQRYGSLINMKIENMRKQHSAIIHKNEKDNEEMKEYAIISVVMGSGVKSLFESLGATDVIEGGQTMNPSTKDITEAIEKAHAKNVLILPNNKNIIMAAEQAAELADVNVAVIPTKTIPQGISSILCYQPEIALDENQKEMTDGIDDVKSGQVTYAVRDTKIDGITIKKGHFMGIYDGNIKATAKDRQETLKLLLKEMITDDDEILTVLHGEDVSETDMDKLTSYLEKTYPELEIEVHNGNQPIYSFILSVE